MSRLRIALLSGGDSSEREIALKSAVTISDSLDRERYDVTIIDVHGLDWVYTDPSGRRWPFDRNTFTLTVDGQVRGFDYAYVIMHGTPGENGMLQGYLEMMRVPFSTGDHVSMAVTFDKVTCKRVVAHGGIDTARDILVSRGQSVDPQAVAAELGLPLFVKPNASGSSCGVTKVKRTEDILPAIEHALTESDRVLIEEFLEGREFACGILVTRDRTLRMPVTEIVSHNEFFDFEAKYAGGKSDEITPAPITDAQRETMQEMAERAYRLCDLRGVARVDFMMSPSGRISMIEINAIPGMSQASLVPQQIRCMGMTVGQVLDMAIADTLHDTAH